MGNRHRIVSKQVDWLVELLVSGKRARIRFESEEQFLGLLSPQHARVPVRAVEQRRSRRV